MKWVYLTPPSIEPVSYPEIKSHLRIDGDDDRDFLIEAIKTARTYGETESQMTFIARQIQLTRYDTEPQNAWVPLSRGPVQSIDSVTDHLGNVVPTGNYDLRRVGTVDYLFLKFVTWPVTVVYTSGFGTNATDVPSDIRQAIKLHVTHIWENRSASTTKAQSHIALGLDATYGHYRADGLIG